VILGGGVAVCCWFTYLAHSAVIFTIVQLSYTFLVPAHSGNPRQNPESRKTVCVCVRACLCGLLFLQYMYLSCHPVSSGITLNELSAPTLTREVTHWLQSFLSSSYILRKGTLMLRGHSILVYDET